MSEVGGEHPLCAAVLLLVLRHGKSNSTDESITEMNEDDSAMIHESGGLRLHQVTAVTEAFYEIQSARVHAAPNGRLVAVINHRHLDACEPCARKHRERRGG